MSAIATQSSDSLNSIPSEIWLRIIAWLVEDEDIAAVWTRCRLVSRMFKREIEQSFSKKHLPKTIIHYSLANDLPADVDDEWLLHPRIGFHFDHVSEDGSTAVFKLEASPDVPDHDVFVSNLRSYFEGIATKPNILMPKHTVQVRRYLNDTPILSISVDYTTLEISCAWVPTVSALLYEETAVLDRMDSWAKESSGLKNEIAQQARGGLDIAAAMKKALEAYGKQLRETFKGARRRRIQQQCKASPSVEDDVVEYDSFHVEIEHAVLADLFELRMEVQDQVFSDEEGYDDEDDDEEEDEWEYYDEEEGSEEEDGIHRSDEE